MGHADAHESWLSVLFAKCAGTMWADYDFRVISITVREYTVQKGEFD